MSSLGHKQAMLPSSGNGLLIGDLLFVEQGLGQKTVVWKAVGGFKVSSPAKQRSGQRSTGR